MAARDHQNSSLAFKQGAKFSPATDCRLIEILHYPSLLNPRWSERRLDDTTISGWYDEDLAIPASPLKSDELETPSRGLRLVAAECDWNEATSTISLSFSGDGFAILEKQLGLHRETLLLLTSSHTRGLQFLPKGLDERHLRGFLFKIPFYRPNFFQITLSHNETTNLTSGLLIVRSNSQVLSSLLILLGSHEAPLNYSILLPVLLAEPLFEASYERLNDCHQRLDNLEEVMGQHEYEGRPKGNPLETDFTSATRSLNWIGNKVGVDILRLRQMLIALEKLDAWGRNTGASRVISNVSPAPNSGVQEPPSGELERVNFYIDTCNILLLEADYEEKRVRALIQVVYQFMAQKDAKVNIHLAESSAVMARASTQDSAVMRTMAVESKKDSSVMKTIAVLGMFFLPGTFVAAIFSMPVFNWAATDDAPLIQKGFGFYWAITAPLTVCVFLVWVLAMLLPWQSWFRRPQMPRVREVELTDI